MCIYGLYTQKLAHPFHIYESENIKENTTQNFFQYIVRFHWLCNSKFGKNNGKYLYLLVTADIDFFTLSSLFEKAATLI